MKITAVSTILLKIPYTNGGPPQLFGGKPWTVMDILLVRLDTDEGITGWGEAFGHAAILGTRATLESLIAPAVLGADATDISGLMHRLHQDLHIFGRNGAVVYGLSGVDIALWDIAGKRAGQPLHQLLGGAGRRELTAYASLLRYTDPSIVAANSARAVGEGYRMIKLHEIGVPQVAAARSAVGDAVELMLDTNCPWSVAEALDMVEALRPFRLHWLEEPVWPPENHAGLARVRAQGTRIAAGENAAGLHDFRHMFEAGALDVAQPSVTKIGGVTEARKVAALAEAFGVRLLPHCAYFGPGYLASLHLTAALPEDTPFERLYIDLEASPFGAWTEARNGRVAVPQAPGLGCDPDPAIIERYRCMPDTVCR